MKRICENCKFWSLAWTLDDVRVGRCHRYPPTISDPEMKKHGFGELFPQVDSQNWCGEFKKTERTNDASTKR